MKTELLYPSSFAVEAALKQGLIKAKPIMAMIAGYDTFCALSGQPIKKGDAVAKNTFETSVGGSFLDAPSMAYQGGEYVCQDSLIVATGDFISKFNNCLIMEDGVFPISTADEMTWWMLNMPEKPFMMMLRRGVNSQHLIWKTPVNLSNKVFQIRHSNYIYTINHARLMRAFKLITEAKDYQSRFGKDGVEVKFTDKHPFLSDNFSISEMRIGVESKSLNADGHALMQKIGDLSFGEIYVLGYMAHAFAANIKGTKLKLWPTIIERKSPKTLAEKAQEKINKKASEDDDAE